MIPDGRRVVVTGVGLITPLGHTLHDTVAALERGDRAVAPVSRFDASGFRQCHAAEVIGFDARQYFTAPKAIKLTDHAARLGVAAARIALRESGYPTTSESLDTLGVIVGSSGADLQPADIASALAPDADARSAEDIEFFARRILSGLNPLWLLVNLPNMISAHIAIQLGAHGPNSTVMTDWVAGLQALGEGAGWIAHGETNAVLAGGADTGVLPFAYGAYEQAGLFDAGDADATLHGLEPGEGAAVFMLEERTTAARRGAVALGEIRAYASASAPIGGADPGGGALGRTLEGALAEAGWRPGEVGVLCTAAPAVPRYAAAHRLAVEVVFGPRGIDLLVPDHASRLGHALGASGAVEASVTLARAPAGSRILCSALGLSGQAVTLAIQSGEDGGGIP